MLTEGSHHHTSVTSGARRAVTKPKPHPKSRYSLVTLHSNGFAEGIHVEGRLYSVQRRLILQGVKVLAPGSTHLTVLDQALRDCAM